jgi:hypothetical protein
LGYYKNSSREDAKNYKGANARHNLTPFHIQKLFELYGIQRKRDVSRLCSPSRLRVNKEITMKPDK